MSEPGAPLALRGSLIKQLSGPLLGEPENKLLPAVAHCGLEQPLLVLVCSGQPACMGKAYGYYYHDTPSPFLIAVALLWAVCVVRLVFNSPECCW